MWDKAHMPIPKAKSGKKLVSLMLSLNHWKSNPRVGWCFLLFFFQPDAGIFSNFLWKHLNCSYKHIFLIVRLLCRFTMSLHRSGFESWLSHLFRSCDSINWKKMEYLFSGMAVAIKIILFFFHSANFDQPQYYSQNLLCTKSLWWGEGQPHIVFS